MQIRFGWGEFERSDVEIKLSTLDMRCYFLEKLAKLRPDIFSDLVRPINFRKLPAELKKDPNWYKIFEACSPIWFEAGLGEAQLQPELIDTPFNRFCAFVNSQRSTLDEIVKELSAENIPQSSADVRRRALLALIPDWDGLQKVAGSLEVCNSIAAFLSAHNLAEPWILDFVVLYFALTKSDIDDFTEGDAAKLDLYRFEYFKNRALESALFNYRYDRTVIDDFIFEPLRIPKSWSVTLPGYRLLETVWKPTVNTKEVFINMVTRQFEEELKHFKTIQDVREINVQTLEFELTEYCSKITELKKANPKLGSEHIPPYVNQLTHEEVFFNPDSENSKDFVERGKTQITRSFAKQKRIVPLVAKQTRTNLLKSLRKYCRDLEKAIPRSRYSRTPKLYLDDLSFDWLIDHLVGRISSFAFDEPTIERRSGSTFDSERVAIGRLSKTIGIKLPPSLRTGRPKGIIESHRRRRVSRDKENRTRTIDEIDD